MTALQPILELSTSMLEDWMESHGWPRFHARQVLQWLFHHRASRFEEMSNLPKAVRAALAAGRQDQAASRLHTLRGVLGNIGAQEAADFALTLEGDLKSGADTGIAGKLQQMDKTLQALFATVGSYLARVDDTSARDTDGLLSNLDTGAVSALLQALKERDLAAVEQFDALYPTIRARLGVNQAQYLRTAMDRLEFAKVEKILADIEVQS